MASNNYLLVIIVGVIVGFGSAAVTFNHLYNDHRDQIIALSKDDAQIIGNKTQAVYAYLDANGLRFENDTGFNVHERLDILQDRGVISTAEERIRINHALNDLENTAQDRLDANYDKKIDIATDLTPLNAALGVALVIIVPAVVIAVVMVGKN